MSAIPGLHILHTPMTVTGRCPDGEPRYCFKCRKRRQFINVVTTPIDAITCPINGKDGWEFGTGAYYGPSVSIRCETCRLVDADVFPGRQREWED